MAKKILKKEKIKELVKAVTGSGGLFIAPKLEARQVVYASIGTDDKVESEYIVPRNSFKDFFFPQTEVVAEFKTGKDGTEVKGAEVSEKKTVVFGSRPCDAASRASLRSVFTWDFKDEFYTRRDDNAVIITAACVRGDESCFCTSVGLKPDSAEGSDILLREAASGDFSAEAVTEKGKAFMAENASIFEDGDAGKLKDLFKPEPLPVDAKKIGERLADTAHYDTPVWPEVARKCIGCGACTFSCPTCHCFDMIDEGSYSKGERRKNWDACQFEMFTMHASGHNPRDTQFKRWRNRFMCKFGIYPGKFKTKGCVGCGRCIRVCPVRLDITEVMEEFSK